MKKMINNRTGETISGFYLNELGRDAMAKAISDAYEAAIIYGDAIEQEMNYWVEFLEENLGLHFPLSGKDGYYVVLEDLHGQHECGLDFYCDIVQLADLFGRLPLHRLSDDDTKRQALWRSLDAAVDRLLQLLPEMKDWLQAGQTIGDSDMYGRWKQIDTESLSDNIDAFIDERDRNSNTKVSADFIREAVECERDVTVNFEAVVRWLEEQILERVEDVFRHHFFGEGLETNLFTQDGEEIWGDWAETE